MYLLFFTAITKNTHLKLSDLFSKVSVFLFSLRFDSIKKVQLDKIDCCI